MNFIINTYDSEWYFLPSLLLSEFLFIGCNKCKYQNGLCSERLKGNQSITCGSIHWTPLIWSESACISNSYSSPFQHLSCSGPCAIWEWHTKLHEELFISSARSCCFSLHQWGCALTDRRKTKTASGDGFRSENKMSRGASGEAARRWREESTKGKGRGNEWHRWTCAE